MSLVFYGEFSRKFMFSSFSATLCPSSLLEMKMAIEEMTFVFVGNLWIDFGSLMNCLQNSRNLQYNFYATDGYWGIFMSFPCDFPGFLSANERAAGWLAFPDWNVDGHGGMAKQWPAATSWNIEISWRRQLSIIYR